MLLPFEAERFEFRRPAGRDEAGIDAGLDLLKDCVVEEQLVHVVDVEVLRVELPQSGNGFDPELWCIQDGSVEDIDLDTFHALATIRIMIGFRRRIGDRHEPHARDGARVQIGGKVDTLDPGCADAQEWLLGRGQGLPEYVLVSTEGPSHAPLFTVSARACGKAAEASGDSKRAAEQLAAEALLTELARG